jgi:heparan-alpha-glucosaminide N-acetyltransferase
MKSRIVSVDIFRALTMLLMIFVNDLWTLHGIPGWLDHTEAHQDGMGLADIVFPAFLFIVGLSIPFAVKARLNNGDSRFKILIHIVKRSLTLIVMGFFMVNLERMSSAISPLFHTLWEVFMIVAFILIWNQYDKEKISRRYTLLLQITGVATLILLAFLYVGGPPEDLQRMRPHWWGILGLIGWAYLLCSLVYLFSGGKTTIIILAVVLFYCLNTLEFIPLKGIPHLPFIVSASNHALIMSGVLATRLYLDTRDSKPVRFLLLLWIAALFLFAFGFALRPHWGISKIRATPSWTSICAAISFSFFSIIFILSDLSGKVKSAGFIKPAGTNTLTCYLIPGFVYPVLLPLQQLLPVELLTGVAGIIKSVLFAFLLVWITGLLEKGGIKLKI